MYEEGTLRAEYGEECNKYQAALDLVSVRLENVLTLTKEGREIVHDPLIKRIKTFESALQKAARKTGKEEGEITIQDITREVQDIAGIRLVVLTRHDIEIIAQRIKNLPGISDLKIRDYVKKPKDSGYKSFHLKVKVEIMTDDGNVGIPVEIQLRTYCMHMWAQVEHMIYKYPEERTGKFDTFRKLLGQISVLIDKIEDCLDKFRTT